ncbi:collagenase [Streptomyces sp. NEAU-Y11]|uniref:collagenase n=1 Tax=Streptomyces cucumeris TaxID=2962890 RepID=UPI0020C8AFCD|nr:collagenase [Streptomyces sp. NEAU-Y11]MCP9205965.1 collagenase [Streptomyces sp. NEAU-Y11]
MIHRPSPRATLLAAATAAALTLPLAPGSPASAAPHSSAASSSTSAARPAAAPGPRATTDRATDHGSRVERLGRAPRTTDGPGRATRARIPGDKATGKAVRHSTVRALDGAVPCTLDAATGLDPERWTDFLADPAVTADDCLRGLIWTWDTRLARVFSPAHVQAVSRRIASLAPSHDGTNGSHLYEMFTYLHAAAYHDFSHDEIDLTDPATVDAMRRGIDAFATAARTFDVTRTNADSLREALYAGSAPGLRQHQLRVIPKVLATMDRDHPATSGDRSWGGAALAALSVNYLGVYPGNKDTAFHQAVTADAGYRGAFKAFAGYVHLKGGENAWVVRDALGEYGRFGQVDALKQAVVADLGPLLDTAKRNFGDGSQPWAKIVGWLNFYEACAPYQVCKADIERRLFPRTYVYDNGGITVRTALDDATVDQLYYASKQVKTQFHRVLGTEEPLSGDTNTTLTTVLYASRADYETYQPILTGLSTDNGGMYIERGATFYTYQRRVPQDSSLSLEELFRHEYTHYLNGRFAVPGYFGEGPWYTGDRTTAMDEGTAEFFDGATRDDGILVRKSLVRGIIADTANGGPRMTVAQLLHATYDGDGFRFYNYAGTFFEFLWRERPALLREMYGRLRADDPQGFDAWRNRMGADTGLQRAYDTFLDEQIAKVDDLFVPNTRYQPIGSLRFATATEVRDAFTSATQNTPRCEKRRGTGTKGWAGRPRFVCTGRITARLADSRDPDRVFRDMSETVDYFILERSRNGGNNFADMNCSFGTVEIWSDGTAGTSPFTCEGPLRG